MCVVLPCGKDEQILQPSDKKAQHAAVSTALKIAVANETIQTDY